MAHGWVAHLLTYWAPTQVYICVGNRMCYIPFNRGEAHAMHANMACRADTECLRSVQSRIIHASMEHDYRIVLYWYCIWGGNCSLGTS